MPNRATFRGPSSWGGDTGSGGSSAPANGPFVTTAADATLTNETLIGAIILPPDVFANRPSATGLVAGTVFWSTDTGAIYRADGANNWVLAGQYLMLVAAGMSVENVGAIESNVNTVAATGATETLDASVYGVFDCTMDQACTFTFSNPAPSGDASMFVLILRGAFTPTLPASVDWGDASAPTYTTPSMYVFTTVDAGTTWLGAQIGKAFG